MQDHKQHMDKEDNILMNKTEHKFMIPRIPANQSHRNYIKMILIMLAAHKI